MPDKAVVQLGEGSREEIALRLLKMVARAEDVALDGQDGQRQPDRQYILSTYAECLQATRGLRPLR